MNPVDYFGQQLNIGDEVAFILCNYRELVTGRIKSIASKTLLAEYTHPTYNRIDETRRDHASCIKKPNQS